MGLPRIVGGILFFVLNVSERRIVDVDQFMSAVRRGAVHRYYGFSTHSLVGQLGQNVTDVALGGFDVGDFSLLALGLVPPIIEYLVVKLGEFAFPG